ncbi:hypothetical protein HYALB_00012392 [Hymenoscyphus albidus]|uniref:GPI inositol-deacylase winged helix domain-containing protein n=1 Tax=Hymenoscyphus albidus TaxID=595503 RepID=A0A9N9LXE0_9HELO|nr:hypothetical protein HYALB_00012392 [Hymenoscyphus albidus]
MSELGIAGSAVGIVSLGMQVCDGLIKYYGSWKDAPTEVLRMCQSVKSLEESLNVLKLSIREEGVATQAEAGIREGIIGCKAGIDKLQQELNKVQEIQGSSVWSKIHGQGRRLLYPFRESTLLKLMGIIADICENLNLAVELLHLSRKPIYHQVVVQNGFLSSPNVRLLCTSRHLGDIEDLFKGAPHLEIRASDEDITKYLDVHIQQVPKVVRFCCKSEDLKTRIVEKLVEKANGMFLLAELHLESLKSKTDIKSLRKSLDILPEARDDVYKEAMKRIQRQPEDEARLAIMVLSWITHVIRPLKMGEIQHAVAVTNFEPEDTTIDEEGLADESDITTACGGLVVIDQDSRNVRLVHYTTQEYFEKHRSKLFPMAHTDIAIASIRYLSMDQFRNGACQTQREFESWLPDFALIQYAVRHWDDHVTNAQNAAVEEYAFEFLNDGTLNICCCANC